MLRSEMNRFLKTELIFKDYGGKVGPLDEMSRGVARAKRKPSSSLVYIDGRFIFAFYSHNIPQVLGPLTDSEWEEIKDEVRKFVSRQAKKLRDFER